MPGAEPGHHAADAPARCAVLTVSDTRTPDDDASGDAIARLVRAAGHAVVRRALVPDDPARIGGVLDAWIADDGIDAILSTGGTGIGRRDTTIEVVRARLTVELDGFGELFRSISFDEIGPAAMLSRALGGLVAPPAEREGETFVFAMPGSPNAATTATSRLVAPMLAHLVGERRRDAGPR